MRSARDIYFSFDGKLVGSRKMKRFVCETLSGMSDKIVDFVTKHCWFFASMEDAWAFTFTGNDLKNDHLIFLSDDLLKENEKQIHYTIAHEIGHVMLGHKNSILKKQTKKEIRKQERDAHNFAIRYTTQK